MESTENWVSLREFARNRGVSLGAVQKAIESRRVTAVKRNEKGRLTAIEMYQATAQWNGNTDVDQATRAGAPIMPEVSGELLLGGQVPGAKPQSDDGRYLSARAKKQEFEAQQAELDYLKALGLIVSVEDLQRVNARRYGMVRDKLLNIPDRVATLLAAERDPARVHASITAEIKRVLNELADDAAAATAGGTTERVAA